MHLLYVDESGKTGLRGDLRRQPCYVLAGVAVHEGSWRRVENDLVSVADRFFPSREDDWELHARDLARGKGKFRRLSCSARGALRDGILDVLDAHALPLFAMVINKQEHLQQYAHPAAPLELAYEFMIERFDSYLRRQNNQFGVIVSDEQKRDEDGIRQAHRRFRRSGTSMKAINHVVETPFFVPSHYAWMIQLADAVAYWTQEFCRASRASAPVPEHWHRLERRFDRVRGKNVGLKIFPLRGQQRSSQVSHRS